MLRRRRDDVETVPETPRGINGDRGRRAWRWLVLVPLGLALLAHLPALWNGFVYDDHWLVERNPVVRTLDPRTHLATPFWSRWETQGGYYRPLVTMSVALDRQLHGTKAWGFHATNLLIHMASVGLLLGLLTRLCDRRAAIFGAALFAVHPVQSEAVVWIMGRTDLLAGLWGLLGVCCWALTGAGRALRLFGLGACFIAALLSKEAAVTFPAWILAWEWARARGEVAANQRRGWPALASRLGGPALACAAALALYALAREAALGEGLPESGDSADDLHNPLRGAPLGLRTINAVHLAARYLGLVAWPKTLSADYRPDAVPVLMSVVSGTFLASLVAVSIATVLAVGLARRQPVALFGLVVAAASYGLVANLAFPVPIVMAERFLYLPMIGVAAMAAGGLALALERRDRPLAPRRWVLGLAVLILLALGGRSLIRAMDWRDDETLFRATTRAAPRSAAAWNNLGVELSVRGRFDEAIPAFEHSLSIRPDYLSPQLNLAAALRRHGDLDAAERRLRQTLRSFPQSAKVQLELVQLLVERGSTRPGAGASADAPLRLREAVALSDGAVARLRGAEDGGGAAVFHLAAAQALERLGDFAGAVRRFDAAIAAADEEATRGGAVPEAAQGVRAAILGAAAALDASQGNTARAAQRFEEAAGLAGQAGRGTVAAQLWLQASRARRQRGEFDRALAACEAARAQVDADPALSEAIAVELATLQARRGDSDAMQSTSEESARVRLARAEGALESGQPSTALVLYDALLDEDPTSLRARLGRGRTRLALVDTEGAREDFEQVLALGPGARLAAATWTDLSRVATGEGDLGEARRRLDRAIELDGGYAEAWYRRALVRAEGGDRSGAEEDLRQAEARGMAADLVTSARRLIAARPLAP